MMYIPKKYGMSRIDKCPFCNKQGTAINKQGVPVCNSHREEVLDGLRCMCGECLEVKSGKYGAYFNCINCGNINLKKGLEINSSSIEKKRIIEKKQEKREITITSDDEWYFS